MEGMTAKEYIGWLKELCDKSCASSICMEFDTEDGFHIKTTVSKNKLHEQQTKKSGS